MRQFQVGKNTLLKAIQTVSLFAAKAGTNNLSYTYIHFSVNKNNLRIEAFNGSSGYRTFVMLTTDTFDYDFCLPAVLTGSTSRLESVINHLQSTSLTFTFPDDEQILILTSGTTTVKLPLTLDEYPNLDEYLIDCEDDETFCQTFDKQLLTTTLAKLYIAAEAKDKNSILSGICFRDGYVGASNGHKLVWSPFPMPENIYFILPQIKTSIDVLMPDCPEVSMKLDFRHSKLLQIESVRDDLFPQIFFTRFLKDEYPNFIKLIPKTTKFDIVLSRSLLLHNTQFISNFSVNPLILFYPNANDGKVEITSKKDINQAQLEMSAEITGDAVPFAFSCQYLTELLSIIQSDTVKISGSSSTSPFLIQPTNEKESIKSILMPVQTKFD